MKKIFTLFAVILCATSAWAWCGNSFITVNGKWYTGSNSYKHEEGYFNGANLGDLTTLVLGGELQVYPKSGEAATLCYKIDDGGEKSISLPKTGEDGNNSKHSGSGKVDLSALSGGEHTISVWFKHKSDYDSNNSKNFVAKFNIPATAPDRYITGTIAGGWDGNEVKMTYDEKTQTYSHTFAANKLSAGVEYKLKVTGGNWDYHCGTINGTIPGVLNDGEGNVCFTLKTVGDVTISFQDAKITVATTGEFKVPVTYEYYILGTMNSWSVKEDYGLADEDNDGIYTREITLTSGQHDFKINVGNWDSQWGWKDVEGNYSEATDAKDDNKIKITLTAEKTFTVLFNTSSKKITFEGLTQIHTVKATINPAEAGTIKGLAADGKYNHGAEATLTAAPAEGYEFVNWTVGGKEVSAKNPYTFTVSADVALVANFKKSVQTITLSYDITAENIGNRQGRQTISVEDENYGNPQLIIPGFSVEVAEYTEASLSINDEILKATATYTNDNGQEVYTATATTADGSIIYNVTFTYALPTTQNYELYAMGISATVESEEGLTTYYLKGNAILGEEYVPVEFMFDNMGNAEGTIGDVFAVGTGEAEQEGTSLYGAVLLQDESGNTYRIEFTAEVEQPEVEIVVKEEVNVALYKLTVDVQGTMATVSAGTEELSFWLTLLQTENHYGDYMNDDFSHIWYGDEQLYAAYGEKHTYGVTDGKVNFVVSFITSPDAEGNVTKYNFTLYAGEKPLDPTALDNLNTTVAPVKMIENGQLIIVKDGVQYNAQGAVVK